MLFPRSDVFSSEHLVFIASVVVETEKLTRAAPQVIGRNRMSTRACMRGIYMI